MQITLASIGVDMATHLLDILGNMLLFCRYDWTKHHVPGVSRVRRVIGPMLMVLIIWTWPQAIKRTPPRRFPNTT